MPKIMRMIFVAEHKRWEASLERAASRIPTIYEEEEEGHQLRQQADEYPDELFLPLPHHGCTATPPACRGRRLTVGVDPVDEFDDLLDRDGRELEDLLSEMDLDLDHKMA